MKKDVKQKLNFYPTIDNEKIEMTMANVYIDKNKAAVEVFNNCAGEYQDKFMDVYLYKDSFDLFCDSISRKAADILEIACGPGNISKYLIQRRPDFKLFGTDLSVNMIELAKINNPTAEFQLMDCRKIGTINKKYDGIMCGFCLPYLSPEEAMKLISDAAGLLKQNGILYLSTMEDVHSKSGFKKSSSGVEVFTNYYPADYLVHALKQNNFDLIDLQRSKCHDESETTDLLIIAKRNTL